MKKIAVIVQSKDAAAAIQQLRSLGVLHVEHAVVPAGPALGARRGDYAVLDETRAILSMEEFRPAKNAPLAKQHNIADVATACHHIIDSWKRLQQVRDYTLALTRQIQEWQPWGDFDPHALADLAHKGIRVALYCIPAGELQRLPQGIVARVVAKKAGVAYCALIGADRAAVPFKEIIPPEMSLRQMREKLAESQKLQRRLGDELRRQTAYSRSLRGAQQSLARDIEFQEAVAGMGAQAALRYVTGYVPADTVASLEQAAQRHQWALFVREPLAEERVPTLLRNPRWVSLIKPIFEAIEVVPGYHEFDASIWFLLFLSVFFGMLIGDAAYGAVFLALTAWAHRKFRSRVDSASVFILFYLFSGCAIIWGLLSGTFFGQAWLPQWVTPLFPALRNDTTVQTLCFLLGAVHLSIAHLWRAMVKAPSPVALAELGWVGILWGAFFLARTLILSAPFPSFAPWLFIAGALLVVVFSAFQKNILKAIGSGFGTLLLNAVNSFTDVVSYIRLFAVGLATVAVADSFNQMAMEAGAGGGAALALSAFILFIGHALNIVLGPMAVLVHGVRLNVLEFSNHLDVKWSGFEYRPLKEQVA